MFKFTEQDLTASASLPSGLFEAVLEDIQYKTDEYNTYEKIEFLFSCTEKDRKGYTYTFSQTYSNKTEKQTKFALSMATLILKAAIDRTKPLSKTDKMVKGENGILQYSVDGVTGDCVLYCINSAKSIEDLAKKFKALLINSVPVRIKLCDSLNADGSRLYTGFKLFKLPFIEPITGNILTFNPELDNDKLSENVMTPPPTVPFATEEYKPKVYKGSEPEATTEEISFVDNDLPF